MSLMPYPEHGTIVLPSIQADTIGHNRLFGSDRFQFLLAFRCLTFRSLIIISTSDSEQPSFCKQQGPRSSLEAGRTY